MENVHPNSEDVNVMPESGNQAEGASHTTESPQEQHQGLNSETKLAALLLQTMLTHEQNLAESSIASRLFAHMRKEVLLARDLPENLKTIHGFWSALTSSSC